MPSEILSPLLLKFVLEYAIGISIKKKKVSGFKIEQGTQPLI